MRKLFSFSSVYIDDTYLSDQFRNNLVENVYKKANQLGGECRLLNKQRQYHSCPLETKERAGLRLSIGYNPKGDYSISVKSTYVHWFPQSDQKITSGKFIGDTQKELEGMDAITCPSRSDHPSGTNILRY